MAEKIPRALLSFSTVVTSMDSYLVVFIRVSQSLLRKEGWRNNGNVAGTNIVSSYWGTLLSCILRLQLGKSFGFD